MTREKKEAMSKVRQAVLCQVLTLRQNRRAAKLATEKKRRKKKQLDPFKPYWEQGKRQNIFQDWQLRELYFDAQEPKDVHPRNLAKRLHSSEATVIRALKKLRKEMGVSTNNELKLKLHEKSRFPLNEEQKEFWRKANLGRGCYSLRDTAILLGDALLQANEPEMLTMPALAKKIDAPLGTVKSVVQKLARQKSIQEVTSGKDLPPLLALKAFVHQKNGVPLSDNELALFSAMNVGKSAAKPKITEPEFQKALLEAREGSDDLAATKLASRFGCDRVTLWSFSKKFITNLAHEMPDYAPIESLGQAKVALHRKLGMPLEPSAVTYWRNYSGLRGAHMREKIETGAL